MQRMRDVLRGQLGRSLRELGPEDRLMAAWQVVCGEAMARRGEVLYLDAENVLHVRVADAQWMGEFLDRRSTLAAEVGRVGAVPLSGIHFEKARMSAQRGATGRSE